MRLATASISWFIAALAVIQVHSAEPQLIGHWPLQHDANDHSTEKLPSQARNVTFDSAGPGGAIASAARFNGRDSKIEIQGGDRLRLGTESFTMSMFINADAASDDVPGDLVSQYDMSTRTGFHLGVYSHGGVTNAQPNSRQVHFGIDQNRREMQFTDHGQLGNAVYVFALCVHDGHLYAATCHAGQQEAGHVFRYDGENRWIDIGTPDKANSISAMCVYDGALYVASSKYRLAGSALSESMNQNLGGGVFRLTEDDKWISCGRLSADIEAVASMVVYNGQLYASSLYAPAGFFRYAGRDSWVSCGTPNGKRVEALAVFNGAIYATSYDEGSIFRFDGTAWQHVGTLPGATQTYGLAIYQGELYVSEWPSAHVYRYGGGMQWTDAGRLDQELEAMPLIVYNGLMYAGSLPSAGVFRYEGNSRWTSIGRVDMTPDVKYRRAWSMAIFKGRMFVGTLPSGHVWSIEAGRNATYDRELASGWHHLAAVRSSDRLRLYIDGNEVAQSATFTASDYDLNPEQCLNVGFGAQDYFCGSIADLRLYDGELTADQIQKLATSVQD